MKRVVDWEIQLEKFYQSRETTPFSRGGHDCALFLIDGIFAITGVDMGKKFRGKYKTKRGAASILRKYGGTLLQTASKLAAEFSCPEIPPQKAQRGDAVYIKTEDSEAVGMVSLDGIHVWVADKGCPTGVGVVPLSAATKAWRIG